MAGAVKLVGDWSLAERTLQWTKIGDNIMELNRDGDGFLVNTNDWSEEVMNQMRLRR